jgi:hypothetical protein
LVLVWVGLQPVLVLRNSSRLLAGLLPHKEWEAGLLVPCLRKLRWKAHRAVKKDLLRTLHCNAKVAM